jgi:N-acetyl-gamma-glutamyl-phosphate reductase
VTRVIPAVVLGASGYVGGELIRLIADHPNFELAAAVSESCKDQPVADTFGHLSALLFDTVFTARDAWLPALDDNTDLALFSAAPHGGSAAMLSHALTQAADRDIAVHTVDSSADFRYAKQDAWESVYGLQHGAPDLLKDFSCAVPEHCNAVTTPHVGHPGCFATATLLAAVPLLQSGLTEAEIFVSGVTGSTGSGRLPQAGTHHPERNSNFYAYKPLAHRHAPEIAALAAAASGQATTVNFVPHSGPFARGIHITLQAKAKRPLTETALRDVFENAYADAPFVKVLNRSPRLKDVVASNYCHLSVATNSDTVVVMSAIDNLVKGAAGGAVQWMNRLWDLPETAGLLAAAPGWT